MRSKIVAYLFHALGMDTTTPLNAFEIPPLSTHIVTYCQLLQAKYETTGIQHMHNTQVTEVKLYKTRGRSQREYISANIHTGGDQFFLAIERHRGNTVTTNNSSGAQDNVASPSQTTPTSTSLTSLNSFLHVREANDRVTSLDRTGRYYFNDQVLHTLSFTTPIPLFELAVLANTVHKTKPKYLLFSENCYFYAGTITKLLEALYESEVEVSTTGSQETDRKHRKKKAGKWNSIKIYDNALDSGLVASMTETFSYEKNEFLQPVWVLTFQTFIVTFYLLLGLP